jgi:hypothetical protein
VDVELIRVDLALHDILAEAVGPGDEDHVSETSSTWPITSIDVAGSATETWTRPSLSRRSKFESPTHERYNGVTSARIPAPPTTEYRLGDLSI